MPRRRGGAAAARWHHRPAGRKGRGRRGIDIDTREREQAAGLDIVAYGEPMVEFNQTGEGGGRLYLQGFGGDSSNFAIAAARQGARVGYFSALGDDGNGRMLRALWEEEGVDHGDSGAAARRPDPHRNLVR